MKSTVIVFFLKIRKVNASICVNSYNKLHILLAKLKNIEFHSAANIPIIFLCMRFTFYAVQLFVFIASSLFSLYADFCPGSACGVSACAENRVVGSFFFYLNYGFSDY